MKEYEDFIKSKIDFKNAVRKSLTSSSERFDLFLNLVKLNSELRSYKERGDFCMGLYPMFDNHHYYSYAISDMEIELINDDKLLEICIDAAVPDDLYGDVESLTFHLELNDLDLSDKELKNKYNDLKKEVESIKTHESEKRASRELRKLKSLAREHGFELKKYKNVGGAE